jgi:large subunit ribosomal protein L24
MVDIDGTLTFDNGAPNFDGVLVLTKAMDAKAAEQGQPWKVTSRVKVNPSLVTFDQVEAAYGPDDNALRLTGSGDMRSEPRRCSSLHWRHGSSMPTSCWRMALRMQSRYGCCPLRVIVPSLPVLPLPAQIELSADQVAVGGRPLLNVAATLQANDKSWTVGKFEMRAPGATRVVASGTISTPGPSARFSGR